MTYNINTAPFDPDSPDKGLAVGSTMQFSQDLQLTNLGNNWYAMVENNTQAVSTVHDALHDQMFLFNTDSRLVAQAFDSDHDGDFDQISAQWLHLELAAEQKEWFQWQPNSGVTSKPVVVGYEQAIDAYGMPLFDELGAPVPDLTRPIEDMQSFVDLGAVRTERFDGTGLMFKKESGQSIANLSEFYNKVSQYVSTSLSATDMDAAGNSGVLLGADSYELLTGGARIDFARDKLDYGYADDDLDQENPFVARQYDSAWIQYDRGNGFAQAFTVEFNLFENNGTNTASGITFTSTLEGRDDDQGSNATPDYQLVDMVGENGMHLRIFDDQGEPTDKGYQMNDSGQYLDPRTGLVYHFDKNNIPKASDYLVPVADNYTGKDLNLLVAHFTSPDAPLAPARMQEWLPAQGSSALASSAELKVLKGQFYTDADNLAVGQFAGVVAKQVLSNKENTESQDEEDSPDVGPSEFAANEISRVAAQAIPGDTWVDHSAPRWTMTDIPTTTATKNSVGSRTALSL